MFDKLKSLFTAKPKQVQSPSAVSGMVGTPYQSLGWAAQCSKTGSYDNNFASISRIAETFAEVAPYAVDEKGERIEVDPLLVQVLNNPNLEMSGAEFREALITKMLVQPMVFLLAWHTEGGKLVPGGKITDQNIAGFTFLEDASAVYLDGGVRYQAANGRVWTKDDVLVFSLNTNPYSVLAGYSPTMAAKKWATVDDFVAEYQAGFFRNNAVPAGMMVVTAKTIEDYNKTVDTLQAKFRGATNANNIAYTHRPTSSIDGKPMASSLEWVPFTQTTDKGTLQSIFDQANKKLDTTFGVPQEVKGYLSNSNYASVEVANYIFERYVIYPKLLKVWGKFTHEMNRLTGGLGYALSFDYELPVLTDALTQQVSALNALLGQGFTLESSVKALKLPSAFAELEKEEEPEPEPEPTANEPQNGFNEETEAGDEAEEQPAEKSIKTKRAKATEPEEDEDEGADAITFLLNAYLAGIIGQALLRYRNNDPDAPLTEGAMKTWLVESGYNQQTADMITATIEAVEEVAGQAALDDFAEQLHINREEAAEQLVFSLTDDEKAELQERVNGLIEDFGNQTVDHIQAVIDRAEYEGWADDRERMRQELQNLDKSEQYRVDRWQESEGHRARETAVLLAALRAGSLASKEPYKTWRINPLSPDICADCIRMNGETVPVDRPFSNGDMVPHYHPWCYCTMAVSFREPMKSVKITCPHCGRYMCESTGGTIKGMICANSKCKRRYDFTVADGKIKAVEVQKEDK